jgi:cell wall-associated NlpC family hydrolase
VKLADAALAMVGTPFHHQGRKPGVGVDCVGLVVCSVRMCGGEVNDVLGYPRTPPSQLMLDAFRKNGLAQVPITDMRENDVLAFWIRRRGLPIHCGIYTSRGLVHVLDHSRVCVVNEADFSRGWREKAHSVWRFR